MAKDQKNFEQDDPLDHVSGTISASSQFIHDSTMIPESTIIPESALVLQDDFGQDEGPQVMGSGNDDEGEVPESLSTAASELPASGKSKGAAIKKNLPMIIFGVVAVGLMGAVGIKFMGSGDPAAAQQQAQTTQSAPSAPSTQAVKAPDMPLVAMTPEVPQALAEQAPSAAYADSSSVAPPPMAAAVAAATTVAAVAAVGSVSPVAAPTVAAVSSVPPVSSVAAPSAVADDLYSTKGMGGTPVATPKAPSAGTLEPVAQAPEKSVDAVLCAPVKRAAKPSVKKTALHGSAPGKHAARRSKVANPPEALPSTEGYGVQMGANGLAWITLPSGESRIVAKGDRIEGLGVVTEINASAHQIRVGRVTLR